MKKHYIICTVLCIITIITLVGCKSNKDSDGHIKATSTPSKNFEYDTKKLTTTITEYNGSKSSVVIPDSIDDSYVTSIDKSVLQNKKINDLTLPSKFKTIKLDTFKGCSNLKKLTYQGSSIEYLYGATNLKDFNAPNLKSLSSISLASLKLENLNIPNFKYVVFNMSKELSFTLTNSNKKTNGNLLFEIDSTLKRSLYTALTSSKAINVNGNKYARPNKKLELKNTWEAINDTNATLKFEKNSAILAITSGTKNNTNTNTYNITDLSIFRSNFAQITTTNPKIKKFGAILIGDYLCMNYNNRLILFRAKSL